MNICYLKMKLLKKWKSPANEIVNILSFLTRSNPTKLRFRTQLSNHSDFISVNSNASECIKKRQSFERRKAIFFSSFTLVSLARPPATFLASFTFVLSVHPVSSRRRLRLPRMKKNEDMTEKTGRLKCHAQHKGTLVCTDPREKSAAHALVLCIITGGYTNMQLTLAFPLAADVSQRRGSFLRRNDARALSSRWIISLSCARLTLIKVARSLMSVDKVLCFVSYNTSARTHLRNLTLLLARSSLIPRMCRSRLRNYCYRCFWFGIEIA